MLSALNTVIIKKNIKVHESIQKKFLTFIEFTYSRK